MDELERFRDKLRTSLEGILDNPEVDAIRGEFTKVMGVVVSPSFEGMNEAQRQAVVWDRVFKTFEPADVKRIEFIYTDAPSELDTPAEPEPEPAATNPGA